MVPPRPPNQPHVIVIRSGHKGSVRRSLPCLPQQASMVAALERAVKELFAYAQFDELELDLCEDGCIAICGHFRSPTPRSEAISRGAPWRAEAAILLEDAVTRVLVEWYGMAWIEDMRVGRSGNQAVCSFMAHSSTHDAD